MIAAQLLSPLTMDLLEAIIAAWALYGLFRFAKTDRETARMRRESVSAWERQRDELRGEQYKALRNELLDEKERGAMLEEDLSSAIVALEQVRALVAKHLEGFAASEPTDERAFPRHLFAGVVAAGVRCGSCGLLWAHPIHLVELPGARA